MVNCPVHDNVKSIWWTEYLLGKCYYSKWEAVSATLGIISILLWLIALLPQVIKNWKLQSTRGLSLAFLLFWLLGDTMSLLGCMILNQLWFQILLSAYFVSIDLLLIGQFYIYREDKHEQSDLGELTSDTVETEYLLAGQQNIMGYVKPKKTIWRTRTIYQYTAIIVLLVTLVYYKVFIKNINWQTPRFEYNLQPYGQFMAWGSSICYHLSRLPQVWHNHKRQSVEGLSLTMFTIIILSNAVYAASLLTLIPVGEPEYLRKTIGFIYGPVGSVILDLFVLLQFYVLNTRNNRRNICLNRDGD